MASSCDDFSVAVPVRSRVAASRRLRQIERDLACSDPEFAQLFGNATWDVAGTPRRGWVRGAARVAGRFIARLALSMACLDPAVCAFRNSLRLQAA